ncbi:MAG TPA: DUF4260 family protein, partial [Pseudolabrys sp.]|nr:DUF4260 family protein [Pseudolabrys sp.]
MNPPAVDGVPRIVLRAEGAALLVVAVMQTSVNRGGYLRSFFWRRMSACSATSGAPAVIYNAAHTLVGPLLLASAGLLLPAFNLMPLALIWIAHIGFDRLLG